MWLPCVIKHIKLKRALKKKKKVGWGRINWTKITSVKTLKQKEKKVGWGKINWNKIMCD